MKLINNLYLSKTSYIIPNPPENIINLAVIQNFNEQHSDVLDYKYDINSINCYPTRINYNELVNNIANLTNVNDNNILITNGSGAALTLILNTYSNKNTNILIPIPNYPGFIHDAELISTNINKYEFYGKHYEYDELINSIQDNEIIYISSPNIPIGYILDNKFIDIIKFNKDKLFIIDEAYIDYTDINNTFINIELENLIIVRTFSKSFAAAALRIGYILANNKIIEKLNIGYCTKSLLDISINISNIIIKNKEYYLDNIKKDKLIWNDFFNKLDNIINENNIIYKYQYSENVPFFVIYTKYPEYVCNLFLKNNYLVRNKTNDLKIGCIRITLGTQNIMDDIYNIIKNINSYGNYDIIYLDIDKTIRMSYELEPIKGVVNYINTLYKTKTINFITNNRNDYTNILNYLNYNNLKFNNLITPLMNYILTDIEQEQGYFIRDKKIFILKFPDYTYNLIKLIEKYKKIYIIEDDEFESPSELGIIGDDVEIPFIESFIKLLKQKYNIDFEIEIIGKQNLIIDTDKTKNILMIGNSENDYLFAKNNDMYFSEVLMINDTNNIIDILQNIK
jgi:histidinol-phosphate aminotransferase